MNQHSHVVILGGTGYIGRAVTQEWLKRDDGARIYTVSAKVPTSSRILASATSKQTVPTLRRCSRCFPSTST